MADDDPWGEMPDWFGDSKGEDEEEEEADNMPGAQHCLILLDCRAEMFDACLQDPDFPEDEQSPMDVALKACEKLVRAKVRMTVVDKGGKRDGFGILLFNTKNRKKITDEDAKQAADGDQRMKQEDDDNDEDEIFAGPTSTTCHEFVPLEPPGVSTVQKIHAATDDPIRGRSMDLQELYESKGDEKESLISPLELGLHQALEAFRTAKCVKKPTKDQPADYRQIWIFTNDSDPASGNEDKLKVLKKAIEDSNENDIDIVVWPMPSRSGKFGDSIYEELGIFTPEDDWNWKDETVLEDMLRQQWKRPRSAMSLPLIFPNWKQENYQIMLDFYRLVRPRTRPATYAIHQETGKVLKSMTQEVAEDGDILAEKITGSDAGGITPSGRLRLRRYHEFGGERIYCSQEDMDKMKVQGNANKEFASLIVLGFKPRDAIPFMQTLDSTYFLYPNEDKAEGSSAAFAHLHASMLRKNVLAIGELLTRVDSPSRLVAIWPIEEEVKKEEMDDQIVARLIRPPGMVCVRLPFGDEIRKIGLDEPIKTSEEADSDLPSEELVKAAMDLVNKQTYQEGVEFGENFENDCLVKFWDYIEHVALNEPLPEKRESSIVVDKAAVLKAAGTEIENFKKLLPEDVKPEKAAAKRKLVPDDSGVDWEQLFIEGNLGSRTIADLKKKLQSVGEKVSGKKQDLVDRIEKILEKELAAKATKKIKEEA